MERKAKVSLGFTELTPNQKGLFGDHVIAEMTDHAIVFPSPDIPLVDLTTANDLLKLKTQQALSGDKVKIAERDAAEKAWDELFRKEAEYVQRIASSDKLIIVQSGFHPTDTEVHPTVIPPQAQLQAWANKGFGSGIHAEVKVLPDVRGYVFLISTIPLDSNAVYVNEDMLNLKVNADIVSMKLTTKRKVEFKDLNSGQLYYLSALGFNTAGVGDLANNVQVIAP